MKDVLFMHVDQKRYGYKGIVFSAKEEGLRTYRNHYEDCIRKGEISKDTPFITPPDEELILQGLAWLDDNDDFVKIKS